MRLHITEHDMIHMLHMIPREQGSPLPMPRDVPCVPRRYAGLAVGGGGIETEHHRLGAVAAAAATHAYLPGFVRRPLRGAMPLWASLHSSSRARASCTERASSCIASILRPEPPQPSW